MTRRGWLLFAVLGVIWGLPYLFIKISVREVSPAFLVLVRTGGAAILLVPLAAARGALLPVLRRWRWLLGYTVAEIAVPWFILFNAERHLSSSLTGLLIAAVPLVGAVLAVMTGTDRLDARRVAGLALGMAGVVALVGLDTAGSSLLAAVSLGVVAVGYAGGPWILAQRLSDLPGLGVVASSLVLCTVIYAPVAAFQLPHGALSGSVIGSMAALSVVCTAAAFLVFFALVGEVGAMRTTVITYVNPAVAVVLGVVVLGEKFGLGTGVGFVLILGGSFLGTKPLRGRARPAGEDQPVRAGAVAAGEVNAAG